MVEQTNAFGEHSPAPHGGKLWEKKTVRGFSPMLMASAFQKAVRRSDEQLAMNCATEMIRSGFDGYLWKRIKIIASEDIAYDAGIVSDIRALYDNSIELRGKSKDFKLFIYHAVTLLLRNKKSRLVDWIKCAFWDGYDTKEELYSIDIPDHVYDTHTVQGKSMGRGLLHFIREGAKLIQRDKFPTEEYYLEETERIWKNGNIIGKWEYKQ